MLHLHKATLPHHPDAEKEIEPDDARRPNTLGHKSIFMEISYSKRH